MNWNTDISQAPRGKTVEATIQSDKGRRKVSRFIPRRVILATKCGKVVLSQYIPDEDRWQMLGKGEQPLAWFVWPEFPHSLSSLPAADSHAAATPPTPRGALSQAGVA